MGIWGKRAPVSDGLIDDRCWNDGALDQALDQLETLSRPAGPDHVAIALDHLATVAKDADRMAMAAGAFGDRFSKDLPVVRQAAGEARSDAE